MGIARQIAALFLVVALASCASESLAGAAERDLKLSVSVSIKEINSRPAPIFTIGLTNRSTSPVLAIDIRRRPDLLIVWITPLHPKFDLAKRICDPPMPRDEDYTEIAPGQTLKVTLDTEAVCYVDFIPAKYTIYAIYNKFLPSELRAGLSRWYRSPDIVFEITK